MYYTESELKKTNIERLFVIQKMLLKELKQVIFCNEIYDKNDIYQELEYIETINLVITKKIKENKKEYAK